jgi:hypothetical protein
MKINKILLNRDVSYGTFEEAAILPLLKDKFNKEIIKNDWYDLFDFRSQDNLYLIELKSRRCTVNQYIDTMVGLNKIEYARKVYPDVQCFFIFNFTNGVFIYKFDPEDNLLYKLGGRNDRNASEMRPYCYIPISLLQPF